ncbi:MAG: L-serine ammonia-lyase [Bacteroidetes bacterium]|nr:L-serine ammonia-lyase [Bacteroidota bacterium]
MESISAFDMIKVGIGPSSSHTMGPWLAANRFIGLLRDGGNLPRVETLRIHLFGSLAKTGRGHGTDLAVLMGLTGLDFTTVDTSTLMDRFDQQKASDTLLLAGLYPVPFRYSHDLLFHADPPAGGHANTLQFTATTRDGHTISETYYSVGGGFVVTASERNGSPSSRIRTPHPCHTGKELADTCQRLGLRVSDLTIINEQAWRSRSGIDNQARLLWKEMTDCLYRGCHASGLLPGGLNVKRRASEINQRLLEGHPYRNKTEWMERLRDQPRDFATINKWITCFALAVNEENASFGRVVTAPTNGAAGVIPAVLMYAWCFLDGVDQETVIRFILTAGEIGTLFKKNATISAAMGGCQAEIGVSSAMAAAALTDCRGGSADQVIQAAEIAMEHHLGLTCDPIGGLVQIPCIERNTMGAIKAITASTLALESDPSEAKVSLDAVIRSMWETARDMSSRYKETSEGGLAAHVPVSVPEC